MKKISVIIPVYNTQEYIGICLSSLVHQTFKDFEIIVINDGSTDKSEEIIKDYQKQYPDLIRYYSFPNQGISKSRNYGIKVSRGEYLSFIDSDDYVDVSFLEEMYNKITSVSASICVCDYYTVLDDEINEYKLDDFNSSDLKNNPQLLFKINTAPWNKLFKKTLFKDLEFSNIKYEDLLLIPKLIIKADKIIKLNRCLNFYRVRENSETTIVDIRSFDILKILEELNTYFKKQKIFDKYYDEIEYFNIYHLRIQMIRQRYQINRDIRERFIDASFNYLEDNFPKWKKNKYYNRNIFKKFIETHRFFTKMYVNRYKRREYED